MKLKDIKVRIANREIEEMKKRMFVYRTLVNNLKGQEYSNRIDGIEENARIEMYENLAIRFEQEITKLLKVVADNNNETEI